MTAKQAFSGLSFDDAEMVSSHLNEWAARPLVERLALGQPEFGQLTGSAGPYWTCWTGLAPCDAHSAYSSEEALLY
jgi:hypothetical protein